MFVCVGSWAGVDVGVGLDWPGEEDPDDEEEYKESDDDEDDEDPVAVAPKIILFGIESPKDVRKFFFLFLFLERRESIVSGTSSSLSPKCSELCEDFDLGAVEFNTPFA
jgi:hypothetical protein